MDFLRSHLIMNAPLSVDDHFQSSLLGGFAVANDWKWSADKGGFIGN